MAEEKSGEFPTVETKELDKLTQKKWGEYLLLFSEVKNRVIWVNPNVDIPIELKEGKPSPLGLFVESAFTFRKKLARKVLPRKHSLEVWPEIHHRSALFRRLSFTDKEGRFYRDIDLKGVGFIEQDRKGKATVGEPGEKEAAHDLGNVIGLLDRDIAFYDKEMSEKFLQAGIRTHRVLAIIELEELIVKGRKISLQEAIKRDIIRYKDFHPVVAVRAFGTKARIRELRDRIDNERKRLLFEDTKKLVSQELGYKESISTEDYVMWFAKTLGYNIGLMHKNGWFHGVLNEINTTLDARIVDLDSVGQLVSERDRKREWESGGNFVYTLEWILGLRRKGTGESFHRIEQFQKSYDSVFPPEEQKRYFSGVPKEK